MAKKFLDQVRISEHNSVICDLRLRITGWYCTATLALCDFKSKADCTHKYPHICEEMVFIDPYKSMRRIEQISRKINVCRIKAVLAYITSFMCILVLFILNLAASTLSLNLQRHLKEVEKKKRSSDLRIFT